MLANILDCDTSDIDYLTDRIHIYQQTVYKDHPDDFSINQLIETTRGGYDDTQIDYLLMTLDELAIKCTLDRIKVDETIYQAFVNNYQSQVHNGRVELDFNDEYLSGLYPDEWKEFTKLFPINELSQYREEK